jgi:Mor family transcriptional regulator
LGRYANARSVTGNNALIIGFMMKDESNKKPDFYEHITESFSPLLHSKEISEADEITEKALHLLAKSLGGIQHYYPRTDIATVVCRNIAINIFSQQYSIDELCERYSINHDEANGVLLDDTVKNKHIAKAERTFLIILDVLNEHDVTDKIDLAELMTLIVCEYSNGIQVYIPNLKTVKMKSRNKNIIKSFNGFNVKELCEKFDLTQVRIYEILRKARQQRQLELKKRV